MKTQYHAPMVQFSPIDALNRRAAALGSPGYAQAAAYADYNGHAVRVWWNDYRRYYITEFCWAGRNVLARGDFEKCLRAALDYYNRGEKGSSVMVALADGDADAAAACDSAPELVPGVEEELPWYTWRHQCAAAAARDAANPGMLVMIFDWGLMQEADSQEEYEQALQAKYGRTYQ